MGIRKFLSLAGILIIVGGITYLSIDHFIGGTDTFPEMQQLVTKIVANNPGIVMLAIHAIPAGQTQSRIVACNIPARIGQPTDPDILTDTAYRRVEGTNYVTTMSIMRAYRPTWFEENNVNYGLSMARVGVAEITAVQSYDKMLIWTALQGAATEPELYRLEEMK